MICDREQIRNSDKHISMQKYFVLIRERTIITIDFKQTFWAANDQGTEEP